MNTNDWSLNGAENTGRDTLAAGVGVLDSAGNYAENYAADHTPELPRAPRLLPSGKVIGLLVFVGLVFWGTRD